jgi:hypothetical protein
MARRKALKTSLSDFMLGGGDESEGEIEIMIGFRNQRWPALPWLSRDSNEEARIDTNARPRAINAIAMPGVLRIMGVYRAVR